MPWVFANIATSSPSQSWPWWRWKQDSNQSDRPGCWHDRAASPGRFCNNRPRSQGETKSDWATKVHPRITPGSSASIGSRHLCTTWNARASDLRWWPSVHFCENGVEPAQAAEPRAHGNLRHWKIRLVEQALRSLYSRRLGDLNRACTQMSLEKPG